MKKKEKINLIVLLAILALIFLGPIFLASIFLPTTHIDANLMVLDVKIGEPIVPNFWAELITTKEGYPTGDKFVKWSFAYFLNDKFVQFVSDGSTRDESRGTFCEATNPQGGCVGEKMWDLQTFPGTKFASEGSVIVRGNDVLRINLPVGKHKLEVKGFHTQTGGTASSNADATNIFSFAIGQPSGTCPAFEWNPSNCISWGYLKERTKKAYTLIQRDWIDGGHADCVFLTDGGGNYSPGSSGTCFAVRSCASCPWGAYSTACSFANLARSLCHDGLFLSYSWGGCCSKDFVKTFSDWSEYRVLLEATEQKAFNSISWEFIADAEFEVKDENAVIVMEESSLGEEKIVPTSDKVVSEESKTSVNLLQGVGTTTLILIIVLITVLLFLSEKNYV